MKLYNTLGRYIEDFVPIDPTEVKLYTCGPTVYDYAHIGNLRAYVFDDTLRRTLILNNYKVKHVMNITDVGHLVSDEDEGEDKLEKGAEREGKTVWEVAKHYTDAFRQDVTALNILPPNGYNKSADGYARATDFINEQLHIIQLLIDKGFAYQTEQAIYFDVSKLPSYGELTKQSLTDKETAARREVHTDLNKKHPQDFAVWFFTVGRFANHEMMWPSPLGDGFPGWHLECSAIIHATLGEPIDIHTGGVDHIGTHHTNEMAQTEAAFGKKLANFWLHNEHLLVNSHKMAKSQGSFYTLRDLTEKKYEPLSLRLLYLQSHYRSQMNFTWEGLDAAASQLKSFRAWADQIYQPQTGDQVNNGAPNEFINSIKEAMSNDLGTPQALAQLNEFIAANLPTKELLTFLDDALGLKLTDQIDVSREQKDLINQREAARQSSNWTKADEIRQELDKQGIEINDTPRGPVWSRK